MLNEIDFVNAESNYTRISLDYIRWHTDFELVSIMVNWNEGDSSITKKNQL